MSTITLKQYKNKYNDEKLKVDRSFNRRVVWTSADRDLYYESLTKNRVPSPHVMADIEMCRDHSEAQGDDISAQYYQKFHDKGYRYISLDGQNRGRAIMDLLNNKVTISGTFLDADGKEQTIKNKFFKDLPNRLQDHFRTGCEIDVKIYDDVLKDELTTIFKSINSGCPLNAQEMRNATLSPIATWVREQRNMYEDAIHKITKPTVINRMIDDENVAKMAIVLTRPNKGLSSKDIDNWYKEGIGYNTVKDPNSPYKWSAIRRAENILKTFASVIDVQKVYAGNKTVAMRSTWATLYAIEWVLDNDHVISDKKEFFKQVKNIDDKLSTRSQLKFAAAKQKALENGYDPNAISSESYYHRWQALPHQPPMRKKLKVELLSELRKSSNMKAMTIRIKARAA
tara:strand:+ start:68 stop:1261 length:1194 start_codon:yes stop_codon:yes gene_type:complete